MFASAWSKVSHGKDDWSVFAAATDDGERVFIVPSDIDLPVWIAHIEDGAVVVERQEPMTLGIKLGGTTAEAGRYPSLQAALLELFPMTAKQKAAMKTLQVAA